MSSKALHVINTSVLINTYLLEENFRVKLWAQKQTLPSPALHGACNSMFVSTLQEFWTVSFQQAELDEV